MRKPCDRLSNCFSTRKLFLELYCWIDLLQTTILNQS